MYRSRHARCRNPERSERLWHLEKGGEDIPVTRALLTPSTDSESRRHTLVECQDELPYLRLLSAESVEPLRLHAMGLDELQALVDDDGQAVAGQLLFLEWDSRYLGGKRL